MGKENREGRIYARIKQSRKQKLEQYCRLWDISIADLLERFIDMLPELPQNDVQNNEDDQGKSPADS